MGVGALECVGGVNGGSVGTISELGDETGCLVVELCFGSPPFATGGPWGVTNGPGVFGTGEDC